MPDARPQTIDDYIALYPETVQQRLQVIRQVIHETAPAATESINYGMPAFRQHNILVYFGAHARHIGLYPTSSGMAAFRDRLAGYAFSKGAVQFPHDQPLPLDLIREIVAFRLAEDIARHA